MKILKTLAALALPSLFMVGCGVGDILNGVLDGGADMSSSSTVYRMCTALYETYDASVGSDGCMDGIMASQLRSNRFVQVNNQSGTVTVYSADMMTQLGTGTILFNMNQGGFSYMQSNVSDGTCRWSTNRTGSLNVTADYDFTITFTDTKNNFMSEAMMTCRKTNGCQNTITLKLRKPTTTQCQ